MSDFRVAQLIKSLVIGVAIFVLSPVAQSAKGELVVLSSDAPPHMISASSSGIDIDIVRSVLMEIGHAVSVDFYPLKRGMEQVKKKRADVFLPTFFREDSDGIFVSNAFIQYRPTAFSLKSSGLSIEKLDDLKGLSVFSFQGASGYFGDKFNSVMEESSYTELHDMSRFPEILLKKRYDVVVLDYYIFYYFLKKYYEKNEHNGNALFPELSSYFSLVEHHDLFPRVDAHAGFHDKALRDAFNVGLEKFDEGSRRSKIIEKYTGAISEEINLLD